MSVNILNYESLRKNESKKCDGKYSFSRNVTIQQPADVLTPPAKAFPQNQRKRIAHRNIAYTHPFVRNLIPTPSTQWRG